MPDLHFDIGTIEYPVLQRFMYERKPVSLIMGPLGSAKTFMILQKILMLCMEQPANERNIRPTRWWVVRNTFGDLERTTIPDFLSIMGPLGEFRQGSGANPPRFRADFFMDDGTRVQAEFIFQGLDGPDAVGKCRSANLTAVWLHEAKELNRDVVDILDSRIRRYPKVAFQGVNCGWGGMLGDFNAPDEMHWLYQTMQEPPPGWGFYVQPGGLLDGGRMPDGSTKWIVNENAENLANLATVCMDCGHGEDGGTGKCPECGSAQFLNYYARTMGGKKPDWIKVNLGNLPGFVVDGLPVHPEYRSHVHELPEQPETLDEPLILGFDFGRTPACAIMQKPRHLDRYIVIDEFCTRVQNIGADPTQRGMSASIFAPELARYLKREYADLPIYASTGDPAGDSGGQTVETTPIQVLHEAGIPCLPADTNAELRRRKAVDDPLTRMSIFDYKPVLLFTPKAKMIRRGMAGGFCFRRMKIIGKEEYTDKPDKNQYSHPCEALEYALMGLGEGQGALNEEEERRSPRQEYADG